MRLSSLTLLTCLSVIAASPDPAHLSPADIYRVHKFDQLTVTDFKNYPVIFVDEDSSVILATFLKEDIYKPQSFKDWRTVLDPVRIKAKLLGNQQFVQIRYDQHLVKTPHPQSFFLDGCFDNSFSETPSTVSRLHSKSLTASGNILLHWYVDAYNFETGLELSASHVHEEKIACTVKSRGKLQMEVTHYFREMILKKQRDIKIEYSLLSSPNLSYRMWKDVEGPRKLKLRMQRMSCVTDPELIQC